MERDINFRQEPWVRRLGFAVILRAVRDIDRGLEMLEASNKREDIRDGKRLLGEVIKWVYSDSGAPTSFSFWLDAASRNDAHRDRLKNFVEAYVSKHTGKISLL